MLHHRRSAFGILGDLVSMLEHLSDFRAHSWCVCKSGGPGQLGRCIDRQSGPPPLRAVNAQLGSTETPSSRESSAADLSLGHICRHHSAGSFFLFHVVSHISHWSLIGNLSFAGPRPAVLHAFSSGCHLTGSHARTQLRKRA